MAPLSRRLLLVFATLGLGASAVSSYVHYQLLTQPGYTSFCDVSERVSCTDAYTSRFGSLAGVPVALGGVLFFALVIVLVVFARRPGSTLRENAPAYIFALSTVALAFVLYLACARSRHLDRLLTQIPEMRASLLGLTVVAVLGSGLNDQGIVVAAAMLAVLNPVLVTLVVPHRHAAGPAPVRPPGNGSGRVEEAASAPAQI